MRCALYLLRHKAFRILFKVSLPIYYLSYCALVFIFSYIWTLNICRCFEKATKVLFSCTHMWRTWIQLWQNLETRENHGNYEISIFIFFLVLSRFPWKSRENQTKESQMTWTCEISKFESCAATRAYAHFPRKKKGKCPKHLKFKGIFPQHLKNISRTT